MTMWHQTREDKEKQGEGSRSTTQDESEKEVQHKGWRRQLKEMHERWTRQGHGPHKMHCTTQNGVDKDRLDKNMHHTISPMMQHAKAKGGRGAAAWSPTLPSQVGQLTSGQLCRALNV